MEKNKELFETYEEDDIDEIENIDNDEFIKLIEDEHIIINEFNGKIVNLGKNAGIEKNKYYSVLNFNTNEEYYIMNCGNKLVKIDFESIDKIKQIKHCWYYCKIGYAYSKINKKQISMHCFLMNRFGNEKDGLSVDHINQNKLDNRLLNLRLVTQSIQNENKPYEKKEDSKYNRNRPLGMENIILPRNMEYRLENEKYHISNGDIKYRIKEYFTYSKYSYNNGKELKSSKSIEKTALEKYNDFIIKLQNIGIKLVYG